MVKYAFLYQGVLLVQVAASYHIWKFRFHTNYVWKMRKYGRYESSKYGIFIQKWSWELPKKGRKEVVATEYGG